MCERGGLETNKGRARGPGVVGRSKKVVMHWRRLNLNELNGELKSLGGFSAAKGRNRLDWCQEIKTKPTTNRPQPTNTLVQPDRRQISKTLFRPIFGGGQAIFSFSLFKTEPRRCRQAQNTLSPWSSDMLSCQ